MIICEILNILEGYPLSYLGFGSAETVHLMVEAMRHAYVDRNTALGDPDFVENPVDRAARQGLRRRRSAPRSTRTAPASRRISTPANGFGESNETTHYSIIDNDGNAVAVTYTLNGWFGAGVVAGGTGILLNNEMDDFTAKPGVPNLYGLVQGEANAIAPKKSPLSLDEPDHRRQGRQAVHGDRQPGRVAHHHHHARGDHERHRPRHDDAGGDRRAAHPPPVAARHGLPRAATPSRRDTRAHARRHGLRPRLEQTERPGARPRASWSAARGSRAPPRRSSKPAAGARYNGAIDSRGPAGAAIGY